MGISMSDTDLNVVHGTSCYSNKENLQAPEISTHNNEEADTFIPLHVLDVANMVVPNITVCSPDTVFLILLLDLFSRNSTPGKSKLERKININECCKSIGKIKAVSLLGLHVFSGANWGGNFFGISKNKWITSYLALELNS